MVKDGKEYHRVPEILDVWFDSGAMPFAQWHYPFENNDRVDAGLSFPADFIAEGQDQTRGWFYTLLAISTLLGKKAPYKNVISTGLIMDKNGKKMSKSKGNIVDPWELFDKYGSDVLRWYLLTLNNPGLPKNFDEQGLVQVTRRFVLTLWNTYSFFVMYANLDGFVPENRAVVAPENMLDKWILAKRDELVRDVTKALEQYEPMAAGLLMEAFVSDLSNWYVRRSRARFWRSDDEKDKNQAYDTLYSVLMDTVKVLAPMMPFLSEAMYQNLKSDEMPQSVHLESWPQVGEVDKEVLAQMQKLRDLVELGLNLREQAGIKVRQPLASFMVKQTEMDPGLLEILKEELNVKEVVLGADEETLNTDISEELRIEGVMRELVRSIQITRKNSGLEVADRIRLEWESNAEDIEKAFFAFKDFIADETLAVEVVKATGLEEKETQLNGNVVKLRVTKQG